jgi:hypothetical protein
VSENMLPQFIGIYPSLTATAVCIWDRHGPRVDVFGSKPPYDSSIAARNGRYFAMWCKVQAVVLSANRIPGESIACIEGYGSSMRGHSQVPMIEYGWYLRHALMDTITLIEVPPACLKKFATGKGNADKLAVCMAVAKRYGVSFDSHDLFDAYVLARMAACYAGYDDPANETQRDVISVLKNGRPKKPKKKTANQEA